MIDTTKVHNAVWNVSCTLGLVGKRAVKKRKKDHLESLQVNFKIDTYACSGMAMTARSQSLDLRIGNKSRRIDAQNADLILTRACGMEPPLEFSKKTPLTRRCENGKKRLFGGSCFAA